MKSITTAKLKELIWEIDEKRFGGEVKRAKARIPLGYHRDADNTFLPYKIRVDKVSRYIHIGAPGNIEQIEYFMRMYGLRSAEECLKAIAENILVELAYDLYDLDKKDRERVIECSIASLFGRKKAQSSELVSDVWSVVLSHIQWSEISNVAKINTSIHKLAVVELKKRRPLVEALWECSPWKNQGCDPSSACFKTIVKQVPLYPQDVSYTYTNDLVEIMRCPDLLKVFKKVGINILGNIIQSSIKYRRAQSNFLKSEGIYTSEEVDLFDRVYINQVSKRERKPISFIRSKFDANSSYWI